MKNFLRDSINFDKLLLQACNNNNKGCLRVNNRREFSFSNKIYKLLNDKIDAERAVFNGSKISTSGVTHINIDLAMIFPRNERHIFAGGIPLQSSSEIGPFERITLRVGPEWFKEELALYQKNGYNKYLSSTGVTSSSNFKDIKRILHHSFPKNIKEAEWLDHSYAFRFSRAGISIFIHVISPRHD